ncbi:hypothetical protein MRY82_02510 [bacterium]|nr:hypothetical protein [bacterium]
MNPKKDKKQELLATFFVGAICFIYVLVFGKPDSKHTQGSNAPPIVSSTPYVAPSQSTSKTVEKTLVQHAVFDSMEPINKSSSGPMLKKPTPAKNTSSLPLTTASYQMPPSTEKLYQSPDEQKNPVALERINNKSFERHSFFSEEGVLNNSEALDKQANDETFTMGSLIASNTQKVSPPNSRQAKPQQSQSAAMKKLHQANTTTFNTTQKRTQQQPFKKQASQESQQEQVSMANTQQDKPKSTSPDSTAPIIKERSPYDYTIKIDPGLCLEEKYFDASDALLRIQGLPDYNDLNFDHTDKQIQSLGFNGTLTVNFLPHHKVLDKPGIDFSIHVPTPKTLGKRRRADIYVKQDTQDIHIGHIAMGTYGSGKAGFDLELFGIDSIDAIMVVDAEQVNKDLFNYCQKEIMPLAGFGIDSIELNHYFEQIENET